MKNYFGIAESVGDDYLMGTWLLNHGFVRIAGPQVGAVAVMQRTFPGANTTSGHVGIISSVADWGTQWKISLRGANQSAGTLLAAEFDCNNVKNTPWSAYSKTKTDIAYYRIAKYAIRSAVAQTGSLYFDVTNGSTSSGAYLLGWTYHGGNNQLYNFLYYGGVYKIIARNSGMCVVPENTSQGARLVQKKCTLSGNLEKWYRSYTSTGYILRNYQTGYVADLASGSLTPGTWIVAWSSHNGLNQRWWLESR